MNKKLSPKAFVLSQIAILIVGSALVFTASAMFQKQDYHNVEGLSTNTPVTSIPASLNLTLDTPDDNTLVYDKGLIVSGTTTPNASVIISLDTNDQGLQADKDGDFSQVITLSPGLNHIVVSAFDPSGNSKQVGRTIYYSEEQI